MTSYFCPKCWQAIDQQTKTCPYCGWDLSRELGYVEKMILALDCPESATARRAAYLLGLLRDPRAVPHLVKRLEGNDPYVAMEAVEALAKIGTEEALRSIRGAYRHRFAPVRKAARDIVRNKTDRYG